MEINGDRLIIREFAASDFQQVHAYGSDPEVVKYMEWGPNSEGATREYLARATSFKDEVPRKTFELAVIEKDTGMFLGGIGLHTSGFQAMLGYCYSRSAWGKGYATEAARLLVGYGFDSLNIHRLWARCDSENLASLRVLEKLGMRREGLARHDCQIRGEWRNTYLYAVLENEWRTAGRPF